jgi:aspartate oxidase
VGSEGEGRQAPAARSIPESERWYFLEEKYPAYGNLVPRDIATREIFQVCLDGFGVFGENQVYLDLTHIPAETLTSKLGAILEIYEMFVGDDPRHVPMRIFPGVHYSMGGLWVDFEQRTNIPGLLAAGECDYSIHGANRLGANSLVSCVYGGFVAAPAAIEFAKNVERNGADGSKIYDDELKRQQEINEGSLKQTGSENQYVIHDEMGKWMTDNVTVVRYNDKLKATDEKLLELIDRYQHISLNDSNMWATHAVPHARQLYNMLQLARVITLGALEPQRVARRALQARLPQPRRRELHEDDHRRVLGRGAGLLLGAVDVGLSSRASATTRRASRRRRPLRAGRPSSRPRRTARRRFPPPALSRSRPTLPAPRRGVRRRRPLTTPSPAKSPRAPSAATRLTKQEGKTEKQ